MVSYEQNLKIDLKPTKLQSGYYAKSTDTKSPIRLTEMWETKEYDVEICRNANRVKSTKPLKKFYLFKLSLQ